MSEQIIEYKDGTLEGERTSLDKLITEPWCPGIDDEPGSSVGAATNNQPRPLGEPSRGRGRPPGAKNKSKDSSRQSEQGEQSSEQQTSSTGHPLDPLRAWIDEAQEKLESRISDSETATEERVKELIEQGLARVPAQRIEIKTDYLEYALEGQVHYFFPLVMKVVASGVNIALSGSTATSKTTMAIQAAKALGRTYYIQPMNDGTTKSDIMGYMSAVGEYIPSSFYRSMKEGAMYIAEEIDSGSAACLLVLNNAVDNRECTFPNGETVMAASGFQVISTMNTKGTGADRKFVGRNRLDAATLDRFCMIEVQRDLSLEASLGGISEPQIDVEPGKGGFPSNQKWLTTVRQARAQYEKSHPDKIISMRAYRDGLKLIQAGVGLDWCIKICIEK